jgi:hypothetical protein
MALLVRRAKVAVAARHGKKSADVKESRASDESVRDCPAQCIPRTADIANGGEATLESVPQHASGKCGAVCLSMLLDPSGVHIRGARMDMCIDHSRHECSASEVDDVRIWRCDRALRYLPDQISFDQHLEPFGALSARAIENTGIFQQNLTHDGLLTMMAAPDAP